MTDQTNNPSNVTILFEKEDHTLGNLVRTQILKDPEVIFAAYKVPHPLARTVEIRIQTLGTSAVDCVDSAITEVVTEIDNFEKAFCEALSL